MAKVLISLSDELLHELDAQAESLGETRSGYLRQLVEQDFERREQEGREEASRLMALIREEFHAGEEPFDAAQAIREDRNSR